jgi:hypothetical protein
MEIYIPIEVDIEFSVYGKYRPPTYYEPAEFPELEITNVIDEYGNNINSLIDELDYWNNLQEIVEENADSDISSYSTTIEIEFIADIKNGQFLITSFLKPFDNLNIQAICDKLISFGYIKILIENNLDIKREIAISNIIP